MFDFPIIVTTLVEWEVFETIYHNKLAETTAIAACHITHAAALAANPILGDDHLTVMCATKQLYSCVCSITKIHQFQSLCQ